MNPNFRLAEGHSLSLWTMDMEGRPMPPEMRCRCGFKTVLNFPSLSESTDATTQAIVRSEIERAIQEHKAVR